MKTVISRASAIRMDRRKSRALLAVGSLTFKNARRKQNAERLFRARA